MQKWRLYIDESGDHTYKHIDNLDTRYLGLTGILINKSFYDQGVQPGLENLKRSIFKYDPDDPPILVRSYIKHRHYWFYVLQDKELNKKWEDAIISFISGLKGHAQVFTVVIDKEQHLKKYPRQTFDPYTYSLEVLLNRVRGYLVNILHESADIIAEARGKVEDKQIKEVYIDLITKGSLYGNTGEYYRQAYPEKALAVSRKITNVAGLQLADIIAYGQKVQTILNYKRPFSKPIDDFTNRLNGAVDKLVNQYGRYLLE